MRASGTPIINALAAAPDRGLVVRQYVWLTVWHRVSRAPFSLGFWSGLLPVDVDVVSGLDGSLITRLYEDGALKSVGKVRLTTGLKIKPWSFTLDKNHPRVRLALREYEPHLGLVEYHRVVLDIASRRPVAPPRCRFVGKIDGTDWTRPRAGGEGMVTVSCIGATGDATKTNAAKRGDESQKLRQDDRHSRYADSTHNWDVKWGEADTAPQSSSGFSMKGRRQ